MTYGAPFIPIEMVNQVLAHFQKTMTFTPYSKITDNISGDETLTAGSTQTIQAAFLQKTQYFEMAKEGQFSLGDGYCIFASTISPTPKKNDQLVIDGDTYRVENTLQRFADANNTTLIYTQAVVTLLT
jgi:hypothetical protein